MSIKSQKRMASELLKTGANRIKIAPKDVEEVSKSITRDDVRDQIKRGNITVKAEKGVSRGRARRKAEQKKKGRRKGHAHRSGTGKAREPKKRAWIRKIRAIRNEIRKFKEEGKIDRRTYRKLYMQAKGNLFHSRRHVGEHVDKVKVN